MRKVLLVLTLVAGLLAATMPRLDAQSTVARYTRYLINNQCVLRSGSGTPEGAVTGNVCDVYVRTDGGDGTTVYIKSSGAGNTGWLPAATSTSSGSSAASYITKVAESGLSNEFALGSLATALLVNTTTTGVPTAYAGTSCTNQFPRSLSAVGAATCASVSLTADVSGVLSTANGGTGQNSTATFPTSGTVATDANALTFTNKTYNAESAGNVLTTVAKEFILAARCDNATASAPDWSFPTSNPAVPACVTGTNVQKGVLDFADGANSLSAQTLRFLPADWTGNIDVRLFWFTPATTGDVVWQVATICVADAETGDPAFNTASTVTDTAKGTTLQFNEATISNVTATGCAAGEVLHLKVFRDPANVADTLADTARLVGVEVTTRRAQ